MPRYSVSLTRYASLEIEAPNKEAVEKFLDAEKADNWYAWDWEQPEIEIFDQLGSYGPDVIVDEEGCEV